MTHAWPAVRLVPSSRKSKDCACRVSRWMWARRWRGHSHLRSWRGRREVGHVTLATGRRGRARQVVRLPLIIHDLRSKWLRSMVDCGLCDHLFVKAHWLIAQVKLLRSFVVRRSSDGYRRVVLPRACRATSRSGRASGLDQCCDRSISGEMVEELRDKISGSFSPETMGQSARLVSLQSAETMAASKAQLWN